MSAPLALPGVDFAPRADADSDDQHTPPWLVAEVDAFFGGIDTDPAWSRIAFIKAGVERKGNDREQMMLYWGERWREFSARFGRFAWVP